MPRPSPVAPAADRPAFPRPRRQAVRAVAAALSLALAAAPAQGADVGGGLLRLVNANVSDKATGALAMLGMTLVPSETASTLYLNTGSGEGMDYQASQLGGAFTVSESFPLYLEGFAGYSRYDPVFVFTDGVDQSRLPTKWTSIGATGGVGWDFKLTDTLVLRPIFNVALGHVESDARLLGRIVSNRLDVDLDFLKDGSMTAGGLGASVMLDYAYYRPEHEIDIELRYTHMHLEPILGSDAINASSDAMTLGLWSRLRVPTGITMFGGPLRSVFEFSGSLLPGDQGEVLHTGWLAQIGTGLEFDTSKTWVPLVTRTRIMLRYTQGEELTGFSVGLAASF
ncbi:hypothetical protein SAMN05444336_101884 [Albimonas donghaensis]|uniref:Autotransporter domain-containing protein n=1 Tax=Albimonas donghaensis TaxID=356660 RepID=A0A1H2T4J0_9RHOB|nr:hypothetical protein [Albimonas donghaensis]SDW38772.1 hypothetical protein SAMN05444336_101884 [Albimonas donghaensis]